MFIYINKEKKTETYITSQNQRNQSDTSLVDCGEDLDCFIENARECKQSKVIWDYNYSLNLFDIINVSVNGSNYMEIQGLEGDKCLYHDEIYNYLISLPEETRQLLLSQGLTAEEIDEQEKAYAATNEAIGTKRNCTLEGALLADALSRWGILTLIQVVN